MIQIYLPLVNTVNTKMRHLTYASSQPKRVSVREFEERRPGVGNLLRLDGRKKNYF